MPNSIKLIRTYKYRLYPTVMQERVLDDIFYVARWLYNRANEIRRREWDLFRHSINYYDLRPMWSKWRNESPDENPLRLLAANSGSELLRRLDKAYAAYFKRLKEWHPQSGRDKPRRPRFKSARHFHSVPYVYGNGTKLDGDCLYVMNVGRIRVRWHRPLPECTIKRVVIKRSSGRWYACFQVEMCVSDIPEHAGPPVGIDVGIKHALALSDGTIIDSPRYLERGQKKLRILQRRVSRKKRGSHRRKKAVRLLARHHEHIANQRRDWWHKVTTWLVQRYSVIVIEDLSLTFMQRSTLARAASDVGLGDFKEMLAYKAVTAGCQIIEVNPQYTSQVCSECGAVVEKALSVRVHDCPACGYKEDRDINAARVILQIGLNGAGNALQAQTWPAGASVA